MLWEKTSEEIGILWEAEYVDGIDGTDIRPGFIKLGFGDDDTITAFHTKILTAAIQTSLRTGLPIQAHIYSTVSARATVDTLERAHFPLHKFIWTHADYPYDLETIVHLAKKGIWIGMDWWVTQPQDMSWHVQLLRTFEQEDLLGQLLISQDAGGYHAGWISPYTPLFEEFIPCCIKMGISETIFEQLLTVNPVRVLKIAEPS
jgi:phosphotriesterase-related protein